MDAKVLEKMTDLAKALEAGYAVGPVGSLNQGAALQVKDLGPMMHNLTYSEAIFKLSKIIPTQKAKALTVEYNRQLSYGSWKGAATLEVSAGQQQTGQYQRAYSAMAFYVTQSVVSLAATLVQTFDGVNNEEREAKNASMRIAQAIEFDLFRGAADFSNNGVFDGSPFAMPSNLVGMVGLEAQIRGSDASLSAVSLDMYEYGAGNSSIISVGGTMAESTLEDAMVRDRLNFGEANTFYLGYAAYSSYNKLAYTKERINLAGSPQTAQGAQLGTQFTAYGNVTLEPTYTLNPKDRPPPQATTGSPLAPTIGLSVASGSTNFSLSNVYTYFVTGENEVGESTGSAISSITVTTAGQQISVTITPAAGTAANFFNVYRSAGATTAASTSVSCKFIGRVANTLAATTLFLDLGNKLPGASSAFLLDKRGMARAQLSNFSSLDVAVIDTAKRRLYFQMECLLVAAPKFNVILENVQ